MTNQQPDLTSGLTMLGRKVTSEEAQGRLETFPNPGAPIVEGAAVLSQVTLKTDEVYANCPITGQPDFYSLTLTYTPFAVCVESKSAKLYIHALRASGIFGEALAVKICNDFYDALAPVNISVELIQKPRGGISIVSHASRYNPRDHFQGESSE